MIEQASIKCSRLAAIHETALGLPNCKEVTFSDEGHMMPLESPERTAAELIAFVNNL